MQIIKEKRKTLSLKIDRNWEIILKAPKNISEKIILDFLEKYKNWINEKQNLVNKQKQKFYFWEKFLFFWELFELKFDENKKFDFDWKYFYSNEKNEENLKKLFIKFYKIQAKKYIFEKIWYFASIFDLKFENLKINSATTRWGSCNSKKNINFSFRLILAPKTSIDYVIIHELAHLKELNHSEKFWNLVDFYCKEVWIFDFKIAKKWLTENSLKTNF